MTFETTVLSGWETYVLILFIGLVGLFVSALIRGIAHLRSLPPDQGLSQMLEIPTLEDSEASGKNQDKERTNQAGRRVNFRFFRGLNMTLSLWPTILLLIPVVTSLKTLSHLGPIIVIFVVLILSLVVSILYANRLGYLDWHGSHHRRPPHEAE
jgi:NADH:ubiquinone oxidoreductase subunit 3 (subunit A)